LYKAKHQQLLAGPGFVLGRKILVKGQIIYVDGYIDYKFGICPIRVGFI
jgi:hypothetical protein